MKDLKKAEKEDRQWKAEACPNGLSHSTSAEQLQKKPCSPPFLLRKKWHTTVGELAGPDGAARE